MRAERRDDETTRKRRAPAHQRHRPPRGFMDTRVTVTDARGRTKTYAPEAFRRRHA